MSHPGEEGRMDGAQFGQPAVDAREIVKVYGAADSGHRALDRVTLDIADNEFFTLLGPSGCGKTTLLRCIAGFETVTSGVLRLFGEEIEALPPNRRPINTVFQNYALFPHMTVAENVAFGLKRLRKPKAEVEARVAEVLAMVRLDQLAARRPSQLSGGQQQRVALARALAPSPRVLLLDEPLSALDLKLRQAMRVELKRIQQETGITFVFVTHDQEEALTMSDRIAVMSAGQVQQVGPAEAIYEAPRNRFVADFIGETNLLDVRVEGVQDGVSLCRHAAGALFRATPAGDPRLGAAGHVSIRPERIALAAPGGGGLEGVVERTVYLGTDTQHVVRLDDGSEVTTRTQNAHDAAAAFGPGDRVGLAIDAGAVRLLVD
jgi:spermidine/putrescine transport system ATP-binding protein